MGWVGVWDWSSCQAMVGLLSSRRIGVGFGVGVLARPWLASRVLDGLGWGLGLEFWPGYGWPLSSRRVGVGFGVGVLDRIRWWSS